MSTTLISIRDTIDVDPYEIIIVDDYSDIPLKLDFPNTQIVRHNDNLGVGASFDTGVKIAKSNNLFLMGSDIRFQKNKWASQMIKEIEHHSKSFTCTSCVNINSENMDIEDRKKVGVPTGATILMFHDKKTNPTVSETFRGVIEAKWLRYITNRDVDSYEIPCILGAAYGVSKEWYNYVDGWAGHRKWGSLEPYIALKSWFFGGSCRVAPRIHTAHIFKKEGTHNTPQDILMYNKMFIATVLFDDYDRIINFLGSNAIVDRARKMYKDNMPWILNKKAEYKKKIVVNAHNFFDKWNIDYRTEQDINPLSKEYDEIYAKPEYHYLKDYSKSPYIKIWRKVLSYIEHSDTVVDLGCGPGQVMMMMWEFSVKKYIGFDFSRTALSIARNLILIFKYKNASVEYIDFHKEFFLPYADAYIAIEVLEHLSDDLKVLSKIPFGKKVILTVPNYLGGSHVRKFDTEQEVMDRYSVALDCKEISTIKYGTGQIFVLYGLKK